MEASAKNPIIGNIIKDRKITMLKFSKVTFPGLRSASIRPEWRPDESLALKTLTNPPLSPEKSGTRVSNVWLLRRVVMEPFNIPPARVPRMEQTKSTGVDCLTIFLISLSEV